VDIGIFDLETSGLYANSSIVMCGVVKEYRGKRITIIRADEFPSWKTGKSDNRDVISAIMKELTRYDILIAHNGQYFDKTWLNSACLKYGLEPQLRGMKFIDPVMIARRHMRIARNSLHSLIDYLEIPEHKTDILFKHWIQASHDSNKKSLDYIVKHCVADVITLEKVYDRVKKLVKSIDDSGSAIR
jgi:uncharacterized protein YprB with RNaseH-like and TPR domain